MPDSHALKPAWINPHTIGSPDTGQINPPSHAPQQLSQQARPTVADDGPPSAHIKATPIGFPVKLAYGAPRFVIRPAYVEVQVYALLFYLQLGAELRLMAFYMAIGRSLDIVTDPLMGWITDTTRLAFGRRKPYLFLGLFLYPVAFGILFHPPVGVDNAHWYGAFYILFFLIDTFVHVPYYALGMEITKDYDERTSVYYWQFLTGQLGILIGGVMPGVLSGFFSFSLRATYAVTGWSFSAIYFIGMGSLLLIVKERPIEEIAKGTIAPMARDIVRILRNQAFMPLLMSMLLDYGVVGMVSAMLPFFVQYVLVVPDTAGCVEPCREWFKDAECDCGKLATLWLSYFIGVVFISAVVSTPFWLFIARCMSKRNAWMLQSIWNVVTNPWFIFCAEGDIYAALMLAVLNGSGFGGQFLNEAIVADVSDYDEFLYGDRLEGMLGTVGTLGPKIVLVFTGVLPIVMVAAAGFRNSEWPADMLERDRLGQKVCEDGDTLDACPKIPQPQSDAVMLMVRLLFCIAPTLVAMASLYFKHIFPIKTAAQMVAIHEGAKLHHQGRPAHDPVTGKAVMTVVVDDPCEMKQLHFLEMWGGAIGDNSSALKALLDCTVPGVNESDIVLSKATIDRGSLQPIYRRATMWVLLPTLSFTAFSVATRATIDMLDEAEQSWVPTCCSLAAGVALTLLIVGGMRLHAARNLPDAGISVALVQRVLWRAFEPSMSTTCTLDQWEEIMCAPTGCQRDTLS